MKIVLISLFAGILPMMVINSVFAKTLPGKELRGVWVEFTDRSWGKVTDTQIKEIVRDLDDNHLNTIFPLTRDYSGGMIYPSIVSTTVQANVLPLLVKEAHQRKIQVHAWMPCLIAGFITKDPILLKHPDWAVTYKDGKTCLDHPIDKCYWWFDPSVPGVRNHLINLVQEMVRQGVDGINFDWLRINGDWTWSSTYRSGFQAQYEIDPMDIKTPEQEKQWHDYRVEIITSLAKEMRDAAKAINPQIKISAAVAPDPEECRKGRLQDWLKWTEFLDFIFPMIYRHPDPSVTSDAKKLIAISKCPVYIGMGGDECMDLTAEQYAELITQARASGTKGFSFYRYDLPNKKTYLNKADLEYFKKTVLRDKVLNP
jgi:uncharacterized lipoprotein YddW (UPF0748 family)